MGRRSSDDTRIYTTHQVARFLGVSLPTVVNWVDAGRILAHRTPGGHRRITHEDLVAFAEAQGLPLTGLRSAVRSGPARVLVVDDEVDFAELVADYLRWKGGYEVTVATSGFLAGVAMERFHPDLVVLDLMMPDMDGFAVLASLRADRETRRVPVIACTGWRDAALVERMRTAGFDAWLDKPVKLEVLREVVATSLQERDAAP